MSLFRNLLIAKATGYPSDATVWEITIPEGGDTAGYEVNNSTYSTVDWGDGTAETFTTNGRHTHFFDAGTYTVGVTSDGTYVTAAGYSGGYATWAKYCTRILHWSELINDFRYMCANMVNLIEVPEEHKTPVASIIGAFYVCYKLKALTMLDLSKLTNTNAQFFAQECRAIISVPPYDTSRIEGFYMFLEACDNLEQIPDFDYSNAINMQHMFRNNSKMKGYARPEMFWENPNNPKYNVYTFSGCRALDNYNEIPAAWGGGGE